MGVDRPLIGLERHPVQYLEQLGAGEDPTGLARHGRQQLELRRSRLHYPPTDRQAHPRNVERQFPRVNDLRSRLSIPLRPPQHGPHARYQLLGAERLDHVVVGTQLEAYQPVTLLTACRQDDDRRAGLPPQGTQHIQAVHPR